MNKTLDLTIRPDRHGVGKKMLFFLFTNFCYVRVIEHLAKHTHKLRNDRFQYSEYEVNIVAIYV